MFSSMYVCIDTSNISIYLKVNISTIHHIGKYYAAVIVSGMVNIVPDNKFYVHSSMKLKLRSSAYQPEYSGLIEIVCDIFLMLT